MDDWKDKIEDWKRRLGEWQTRFDAEFARIGRKRKRLFRPLGAGEIEDIAAEARRAAGEALLVELFHFMTQLTDAYLAEPLPAPRAKVRAWMGCDPNTVNAAWSYAVQSLDLVRGKNDEAQFKRGLAALSILDLRRDYNDVMDLLAHYWIAGSKQGFEAKTHFDAIAKLSNPGMGGGGACFAEILRDFSATSYFRAHVRPELGRASA